MTEYKTVSMNDVLTDKQIKVVSKLVRQKKTTELKKYLNEIKDQLESKGVVADYLYYLLCYKFGLS